MDGCRAVSWRENARSVLPLAGYCSLTTWEMLECVETVEQLWTCDEIVVSTRLARNAAVETCEGGS